MLNEQNTNDTFLYFFIFSFFQQIKTYAADCNFFSFALIYIFSSQVEIKNIV